MSELSKLNKPSVSVFMPTFNHVKFIDAAFKSVLEQNYSDLQIVVGDDASTDGTTQIVKDYAARFPDTIVPLVDDPHLGATGNFNRILKRCKGKYIVILSGDDILLPDKISKQVSWLEEDDRRVICNHDVEVFDDESGRVLWVWPGVNGRGPIPLVAKGCIITGGTVMVRADAVPPSGFDSRLVVGSDWKFCIDILARTGGYFGAVNGVYSRYRRHSGNASQTWVGWTDYFVTLALVEAEYPELARYAGYFRPQLYAWVAEWCTTHGHLGAAKEYSETGQMLQQALNQDGLKKLPESVRQLVLRLIRR